MPLTDLQQKVLRVIAANRSEESHFAGGIVLHSRENSVRYSHDFDIFHDAAEAVAMASERDIGALREAGYDVDQTAGDWSQPVTFRKATVREGKEKLEIDWAADSAVRFFPIERDPLLGWRLHLFDMACWPRVHLPGE